MFLSDIVIISPVWKNTIMLCSSSKRFYIFFPEGGEEEDGGGVVDPPFSAKHMHLCACPFAGLFFPVEFLLPPDVSD